MFPTLPVLMALSWVPTVNTAQAPVPTPAVQKTEQSAEATNTIKCPITGNQIPSCCCPVKK